MLARQASTHAVSPQRAQSKENTWELWVEFCTEHEVDPLLNQVEDPIPFFQVFGQRWRDGRTAPLGNPVRARTVEDAWRKVGQTMASVGSKDHRNTPAGKLVYRLAQQLRGYKQEDNPATRVKPVPLALVRRTWETATTNRTRAIGDMCLIGFFFLCRPGEHVETTSPKHLSTPFNMCDVQFLVERRWWAGHEIPLEALDASRSVTLRYTNQKNGVQGQGITMGSTGHPHICPVRTLARRIQHLRAHQSTPRTPIFTFYEEAGNQPKQIFSVHLTTALRTAAAALYPILGIDPKDISARSLRPGGATAMLCANIDRDITQLIGRWKSDEMLKYLHVQAGALMHNYARQMFDHGDYTYHPEADTDDAATFLGPFAASEIPATESTIPHPLP